MPLSHHVLDLASVSPVVWISLYVMDSGKGSYLYFYDFLHRVSCLEPQNHETLCALRQAAGPGKPTFLQEQLIFCMRNRSAPRYSCQAPLARVCTKPQGLFHGLSLPVEAAKHKHRLPTLESRSFNPPVQKVLSNHFSLNCKCKKDEKCSENAWNTSVWSYFSQKKKRERRERARRRRRNVFQL